MKLKKLFKNLEGYNNFAEMIGEEQKEIKCYIEFCDVYQAGTYKELENKIKREFIEDFAKQVLELDVEFGEVYRVNGERVDFFYVEKAK